MPSIFTKIVNREIQAHIIWEDDNFLVFLDAFPLALGHTLVIPKKEVNYIFDLEENLYIGIWALAKQIAPAIEKAIPCLRIGVSVIGLEVPHAHIHLIPLNSMRDINFERPKMQVSQEILLDTAKKISSHITL